MKDLGKKTEHEPRDDQYEKFSSKLPPGMLLQLRAIAKNKSIPFYVVLKQAGDCFLLKEGLEKAPLPDQKRAWSSLSFLKKFGFLRKKQS